ncbi:glycoside hydrolase family 18 protein [Providencia sp. Me31A]|uniref:chitinase n=1 Tax=Providencia sp. Me31A TaxID=3392637 RepID=UPI003D2A8067
MSNTKFGPYLDVSVDALWWPDSRPNPKYSSAAIKYKMDMLYLGFLTADINNKAAWSAQSATPINWAKPLCDELIAGGVDFAVSFGGAANNDISYVQTKEELIKSYQEVINSLGANCLDFDLENGRYNEDKIFAALQVIKSNNPQIKLSITLPTTTSGLSSTGLLLIKKSFDAGLTMKVNGMAMDYYQGQNINMGEAVISTINGMKKQLSTIFTGLTDEELFSLIQVTPMIGLNDDRSLFKFQDVKLVSDFSKKNGVDLVSMWSLTRDKPGGSNQVAQPTNSGNPEQTKEFEYSELFTKYLKS